MAERAVFLDRDNTLIPNDGDLGDPDQVRLLEGVAPALARLADAGFRLVVVSNQGGVARGRYGEADVEAVHRRIASLVDEAAGRRGLIDRFYYCPYHPEGTIEAYAREHPWRKPRPGMLLAAEGDLGLDLARSWLIGDQPRDVEAGRAAGCSTVLISGDEAAIVEAEATAVVGSIGEAVEVVLGQGMAIGE
jgi:histidinol-phosphate phosphatase family protein